MSKPSSYELRLIQMITRAESKLKELMIEHPVNCPVNDPHWSGECTCGASARNRKIDEILSELKFE